MNWDNHLSSIMTATDGSVAKIRERLITHGRLSRGKEDVYPVNESRAVGLDPSLPASFSQASPALSGTVQWRDLAVIQAQLHSQSQVIESLTQNLRSVERERDSQQRQIQTLQEEVRRLWERLQERATEREPGAMRRLEQLEREVGQELSSLRGHVTRAASLGNQEESFRSKLHQLELEQLRNQLLRQEEEIYQQQSEMREMRRQCECSWKTLESLVDSCSAHRCGLDRTQHGQTQLDMQELRLKVSELKDNVKDLVFRHRLPTTAYVLQKPTPVAAVSVDTSPPRQLLSRSDSEDGFSPTPSLGEVSSNEPDTSLLGDAALKRRIHGEDTHLSPTVSDAGSDAGRGLGSNHDHTHSKLEGGVSDSSPDLSLSDL